VAHASSLLPVTATRGTSPAPLRLLFVCTANISRSPYAERRAAHLLRELGAAGESVTVESAGIPGYPGRDTDAPMAAQLRRRGGDPTGHVSRSLTSEMLALADVVVTFEFAQRMRILESHPGWGHKLFGLHQLVDAVDRTPGGATGYRLVHELQLAAAPDSMSWDVADPYGRGASAAHQTADAIDGALSVIIPVLVGLEPGRVQPPRQGTARQRVPGLRVVLGRRPRRGDRRPC
jgi:protein-tyrosine phosphatase